MKASKPQIMFDNLDWKAFALNMLPHIEEGIAALDTDGQVLFCNDAFLRLTGKAAQQVQGHLLEKLFSEQATGKWLYGESTVKEIKHRQQVFEIRLIPTLTASQTHSGGAAIVRKIRSAGSQHPPAALENLASINRQLVSEVQTREKLQAQLQESQYFIKQVADASPDVLYVYDLQEKRSIYINREIYNKLGYTPEEFYALGSNATLTITHPEDFSRRQAHFEKVKNLKDGEILKIEYRVKTMKGNWIWVRTRDAVFRRTAEGIPSQLIGISQDITEIKQAEEQLLESQHFIQQITDTSPDHLYVFDLLQNRLVYINKEIIRTMGYTPEHLYSLGENVIASIMHPDDILPVVRHLQSFATVRDRDVQEIEYRMKDAQGGWHWILAREVVFKRTPEGIPCQIMGISRDISEKKQAQEELRYKTQLIDNMIASFPVVLSRIDKNGVIQEMIGQGLRSFGLKNNQLTGYNVLEQNWQVAPYIQEALNGKKTSFIFLHKHKGKKRYFQSYYFFDPVKECACGFSVDVTEQKETEEKLKQSEAQLTILNEELEYRVQERTRRLSDSEERYRSLVMASSSIVWTANSQGEMTAENKQWELFTGQTFEQYRNMGWVHAILPADRVNNKQIWIKALENKQSVNTEYRLLHHSGQYRYMAVRVVPVIKEDGEIQEWVGTCTDIHDRRIAEEALRRSEQRYQIAASVTHDAIWDWDLITNELTYTSGYYDIFGYTEAEVVGTIAEWMGRIHPDDAERIVHSIQSVIDSGATLWTDEYRHLRKGGSFAYVYDRAYVQHDKSGKAIRMVGAMADITERKLAEDALRRNEEQLRLITDALPVLISYIDTGERYRFCNKTYEEWFGIPREKTYGMHVSDLLGNQVYYYLKTHIDTALQGKKISFEATLHYSKAGLRTVNATYIPHLEAGTVKGFYVLVSDISERKKAEEALSASESKFRRVFESDMIGILFFEEDGKILECNDKFLHIVGYTRQDLKAGQMNWRKMTPPGYRQQDQLAIAQIRATGVAAPFEKEYIRKDGKQVPVIVGGASLEEYAGKGVAFVLDITGQKTVQQSLALSEERFRMVSKATNDIIWDWDIVNNLIWWNDGLRVLFGYKPEEVEPGPESWYSRIHSEDVDRVLEGIHKIIDAGAEQWSDEYRFRKADGSYGFVLDRGYILHDKEGNSIRMIGSKVDITYMKETQEALEQQAQELRQSNMDLEQFAYISSHDLQEPLNTASSFAKLLARKYKHQLDPDAHEFIDFIVSATDRMKQLIRSLLDYSKINSSGKLLEPTDIAMAITQAQDNLKATILENGVRIFADPMPVVPANPSQMVQLFQNLMGNAIKFKSALPPEISITVREGENHYLFAVSDNGIGMDIKYASKIFQVFQRLHSRDEYEGTGIGLATCKRIVERHGGLIWVESQPGKGSAFYFTIRK
jgi:PAS domain S-box-containing protein